MCEKKRKRNCDQQFLFLIWGSNRWCKGECYFLEVPLWLSLYIMYNTITRIIKNSIRVPPLHYTFIVSSERFTIHRLLSPYQMFHTKYGSIILSYFIWKISNEKNVPIMLKFMPFFILFITFSLYFWENKTIIMHKYKYFWK